MTFSTRVHVIAVSQTVGGGPGFIVGEERERSLGSQGGAGTGEKGTPRRLYFGP